ncbi:hypothetical protein CPB97_004156 [Podila verticillata]|nr:hypothetical protein CPB97_004156 [Podila verticillata]
MDVGYGPSNCIPATPSNPPRVLIVGAGIGGLTLAILLELAGIPYELFERYHENKAYGSAIALGPGVVPIFRQIGIYNEFLKLAKIASCIQVFNEERKPEFIMDFSPLLKMGGASGFIIARPALHDLLRRQIPDEKVHMGKRVRSMQQGDNWVKIHCTDNTSYTGDILVGADGVNSGVRQSLYQQLKEAGTLVPSDGLAMPFSCVGLVGQTVPLKPSGYPGLEEECSQFLTVLGENKPYSWSTFTTKDNTICWAVFQYLDKVSSKANDSFRASDWGPEAAIAMCHEVYNFPIPGGVGNNMELRDLFDFTPKELISKVVIEEKVFDTWFGGRTVLLGDACHKFNPSGGAGALTSMQDAVALANWINVLPSYSLKDLETIFKEYRAERLPVAKQTFETSQMLGKVTATNMKAKMTRFVTRHLPAWLWKVILTKMAADRPQVSFLPLVEDNGSLKPKAQPSLQKTISLAAASSSSAVNLHGVTI